MMSFASHLGERRGQFGVQRYSFICKFPRYPMVLNYSNARFDCCNLFETQKHTSFSICQMKMNDEAGE